MNSRVEPAPQDIESGSDPVRRTVPSRCCLLAIREETLVVDLNHVREVFRVELITPVPGLPSVFLGVANLRGTVIPLADLGVLMGMPRLSKPKYAAVVGHGGGQIGILIDHVPEILTLDGGDVHEEAPVEPVRVASFLSGRLHVAGRIGSVVEIPKLLALVEHMNDQHGQGVMVGGTEADTNERGVTSDGEGHGHGEA